PPHARPPAPRERRVPARDVRDRRRHEGAARTSPQAHRDERYVEARRAARSPLVRGPGWRTLRGGREARARRRRPGDGGAPRAFGRGHRSRQARRTVNPLLLLMGLLLVAYLGSFLVGGERSVSGVGLPSSVEWVVLGAVIGPSALGVVSTSVVD